MALLAIRKLIVVLGWYKQFNLIGRFFSKPVQFCRVVILCDKPLANRESFVPFVAIVIPLR